MTKKSADIAGKVYWRDNKHFADLFNAVFFNGKQVLHERELTEADSEVSNHVLKKSDVFDVSKTRDIIKKVSSDADYILLGIENQMNIHYGMPLRTMLYDALSYLKQCEVLKKRHRIEKDTENADEFLSGLKREERLHPVFTVVIYYGEKPWDGPKKLSDMMALRKEWQPFFEDYSMRLIEVVDGEVLPFQDEENRLLFEMIKDVNKLSKKELLAKYRQEAIPKSVAIAVGEMTGTKVLIDLALQTKGDEIMCSNMDRIFAEERAEGRQQEREEIIRKLLKHGMDTKQVANILEVSEEEIESVFAMA